MKRGRTWFIVLALCMIMAFAPAAQAAQLTAEKDVQNNAIVTLSEETDQTENPEKTEMSDQTGDQDPADPETSDIGAGEEGEQGDLSDGSGEGSTDGQLSDGNDQNDGQDSAASFWWKLEDEF